MKIWVFTLRLSKDYEEDGKKYGQGDELFITGNEQKIYFPKAEHANYKVWYRIHTLLN